jgi:hypothetical protein
VNGDAQAMQARLEDWFNDSMSRVSGWYKRRTQVILFAIGLFVSMALNIDSFSLARQLVTEPAVREALVKQAGAIVEHAQSQASTPTTSSDSTAATGGTKPAMGGLDSMSLKTIQSRIGALQQAGLVSISSGGACSLSARFWPWSSVTKGATCDSDFEAVIGILLTAVALSFGAPFWFDALNKLVNMRQAGVPPDTGKK